MKYLGGKARIAKELSAFIAARHVDRWLFVEPFMGGGNMTAALAPYFQHGFAYDVVPDLALLYEALRDGWVPPDAIDEPEYLRLKNAPPSALRAFAGFGLAFGGDFFHGYAKDKRGDDYCGAAKRACLKQNAATANVHFATASYDTLSPIPGAVAYCDPPYASTSGYSCGAFDHAKFWATMRDWRAAGAHVYVSEYTAPPDWSCAWEKQRMQGLRDADGSQAVKVERLFV